MKRHILFASALVLSACSAPPVTYEAGIDVAGMDMTVKPGDDFFAYANGAWDKSAEIPADRSSWGGNAILAEQVDKDVAALIEGAGKGSPKPGSEAALIADFYTAYMDEAGIEAKGLAPLKPGSRRLAPSPTRRACPPISDRTVRAERRRAQHHRAHTDNVLGLWVAADFDEPTRMRPSSSRAASACPTASITSTLRRA